MYKNYVKRAIDIILSFLGIMVLLIPMLIVAIMIKIDSKGPVLFKQKRVGLHKKEFTILKFRSMPVTVPKDMPTHLFNAEDSLSKFQKLIRKLSIDELPQIYCIFIGTMTIIGPRPALFNQEDLLWERDKYGANDIKPGLTGWAQINGRDELPIDLKASLDGEYAKILNEGGFKAFLMDTKCFFGTILKVLKSDGVVEGGTGSRKKEEISK
ncbi:MAG: sugar transferase [Clostridia bacterium]|nr:sugar transferase [Clostridia bacterium]